MSEPDQPEKPTVVYTVDYSNSVNQWQVCYSDGGFYLAKNQGGYQCLKLDQCYDTRKAAVSAALKSAQKKVTDANADVNRLIAELNK